MWCGTCGIEINEDKDNYVLCNNCGNAFCIGCFGLGENECSECGEFDNFELFID